MECFSPQEIRLPDGRLQVVRCGKCLACLSHRQAEWITRLRVALDASPESTYFVTLTYDQDHLPYNTAKFDVPEQGIEYMDKIPTVRKSDLQKFHMDLRKRFQQGFYYDDTLSKCGFGKAQKIALPLCKFRFYCTSEYGPLGLRPHYHGFYTHLPEDADLTFDLFNKIWNRGFVYCEKAQSDKAAAYVAKYLVNTSLVPVCPFADRPFALMSKGLGAEYLTEKRVEWHRAAHLVRSFVPLQGGKQILPRYLRDKIFDDAMKADILEAEIDRQESAAFALSTLDPQSLARYEEKLRHDHDEAYRQAEWRFRKSGKIK